FISLYFIQRENTRLAPKILFSLLASLLIESINPALFVFILLLSNERGYRLIPLFSLALIGTSFLYLAPGNFARASSDSHLALSFTSLVQDLLYVFYKSLRYIWAPSVLAILGGILSAFCGVVLQPKITCKRYIFILAALASISPFVLVPDHFNGRSSSLFVIL